MAIVNSFPAYNVTGAIFHFVRIPGSSNIYYLGTCETQPDAHIRNARAAVMDDNAGHMLPAQKSDQGQMADIALPLVRYSELAFGQIRTVRGTGNGLQQAIGWQGRFSRGSMIFGSDTFELWQVFENSLNNTFRQTNMPLGRYWPQIELVEATPVKTGAQEQIMLLILEAQQYHVPQAVYTAVSGTERSFVLYKEDDGSFPSEVLVPQ